MYLQKQHCPHSLPDILGKELANLQMGETWAPVYSLGFVLIENNLLQEMQTVAYNPH